MEPKVTQAKMWKRKVTELFFINYISHGLTSVSHGPVTPKDPKLGSFSYVIKIIFRLNFSLRN